MADPHVISALKRKRHEIEQAIASYEKRTKLARKDLAHVNASIRLFEVGDEPQQFPAYIDIHRLFKRGEIWSYAKRPWPRKASLQPVI